MQIGFRFRLYPTPKQAQTLLRWIGCQRHIYNDKVREERYYRTFSRKSLQHTGQYAPIDQTYAQFIGEDTAYLREVPAFVLRNGAVSWFKAYSRFFKKLSGRPKIKKKSGAQSVWLTSELFRFAPKSDALTGELRLSLNVGTAKCPVGDIAYTAHRAHHTPNSVRITVEAGRWFLSFSEEDDQIVPSAQETADWLSGFTTPELTARAVGVDRGVAVPFALSNGATFDLAAIQRTRIQKKQAAAARWQRKLARRQKGSRNRRKAAHRVAALRQYEKNVRRDFAHQTSHRIVSDPQTLLVVFEALGVQRMTKRPKARQDALGKWLRNGARAKAGLNRSILSSAWAKTKECCTYKAQRAGKLVIEVPAHHTSQACSHCGFTHPDNRPAQAAFVCQSCGHSENADLNASRNIRSRGVQLIVSGAFLEKVQKKTMRMRKKGTKVGADCSDIMPVEAPISRCSGNGAAQRPAKQEDCAAMPVEAPISTGIAG